MSNYRFASKIAFRYLRTKRAEAFINIISVISIIGVALSVAVLIISMAIMTGFERELRNKVVGSAHIILTHFSGVVKDWEKIQKEVEATKGVESVSAYTEHQALLSINGRVQGVLVRGIQPKSSTEHELSGYLTNKESLQGLYKNFEGQTSMSDGTRQPANLPGIIIGKELATRMGILKAVPLSLLSPQVSSSPFGLMPRYKRFIVSDVYASGLTGYESALVYLGLPEAQKFFRMNKAVSALEIKVENPDAAATIAASIKQRVEGVFSEGFIVSDWTVQNKELWEAIKLEKRVYFIVLLLLIVLASFSIISTLVMVVLEKRKDIAIMRSFGARSGDIAMIFRIQGMTIGVLGTFAGLILGYLGCWGLEHFGFPLPEKVFPTATVPVQIDFINFILIAIATLVICFLSTLYPARRASKLEPVEILRYE